MHLQVQLSLHTDSKRSVFACNMRVSVTNNNLLSSHPMLVRNFSFGLKQIRVRSSKTNDPKTTVRITIPTHPAAWAEGLGSDADMRVRVWELVFRVSTFSSFVMLSTFSWVTGSRFSKLTPPALQEQSQLLDAQTSTSSTK